MDKQSVVVLASVALLVSACAAEPEPSGRPSVSSPTMVVQAGTPMPCAVAEAAKINCQGCHAAQPIGGAPMPLMTYADFQSDYTVKTSDGLIGQAIKMHALAHQRVLGSVTGRPMPPLEIEATQKQTLIDWLASGAPAGSEVDRTCMMMLPVGGAGGVGGSVAGMGGGAGEAGSAAGGGGTGGGGEPTYSMEPLVPRTEIGEKCYDLPTHGVQAAGDTSQYMIEPGETYVQFYFDVPWGGDEVASRFGARFDNIPVLHHWLLFTGSTNNAAGSYKVLRSDSEVVTNQEQGQQLLAGWAIGGSSLTMPDDVALDLPQPGGRLNVQWHYYNTASGQPAPDASAVQVCTVPRGSRPNLAGITWLGTEAIPGPAAFGQGMGPGMQQFSGTCENDSGADITVVAFWPHMHRIGANMASSVNGVEVFNKPFYPERQVHYRLDTRVVLKPADKITATCTFNNTTGRLVGFGESTDDEMCYQFAISYPARALDNGASSLIAASNTCWGD